MLQEMRQYTKSWLPWLFVIPLVVSFAAWGINDVFRPAVPVDEFVLKYQKPM